MAVPLFCGQEARNRNEFSSTFAPGTCEFEFQRAMVSNFNRKLRTNERERMIESGGKVRSRNGLENCIQTDSVRLFYAVKATFDVNAHIKIK